MKKHILFLFILFLSCNLIAQNPFVKKIEYNGDIKELINKNEFRFFTSNVEIIDYVAADGKTVHELFYQGKYKYIDPEYINKYKNIDLREDGYIYKNKSTYDGKSELKYEILSLAKLNIYYEEYKFQNFNFYFDENYIYLRGFDNDNYIEFIQELSTLDFVNKPSKISRFFLFDNFDYVSYIKEYVQKNINKWQLKGEFEKMSEYSLRVTEKETLKEIKKFQNEAMEEIKNYFWKNIGKNSIFKLNTYDPENETFIVNSELFGDLPIKVSIDKAVFFKDNFNKIKFENPEFVLNNNKLVLCNLDFVLNTTKSTYPPDNSGKIFWSYNINEKLKYTNTVIDYNFDKIDINVAQSSINKPVTTIENKNISVGKSSVDVNIPENTKVPNRYALIIGNEDYQSMQRTLNSEQNVAFAVNDATIFRDYAIKTLGIEQENITFLTNATAGQMSQQIDKVCKMLSKLGDKAELIVYYAGHGYPDEITKVPYLIPVDVSASNLDMAIKLNEFYKNLSATNAKRIVVFLDACFTGGGRTSGLLASRGVKVIPKEDALNGNIVVVSASSGVQSALPYQNEKHGMFSYYLLKKLQESKGNTSIGNLFSYIKDNVSLQSLKINNKEQDPTINFSSAVEKDYESWNFKN